MDHPTPPAALAAGWLRIENGHDHAIELIFEPWGVTVGPPLPPGEAFDVFVVPLANSGAPEVPHMIVHHDTITLYADLYRSAVYFRGEPADLTARLLDIIPVPPFRPWRSP